MRASYHATVRYIERVLGQEDLVAGIKEITEKDKDVLKVMKELFEFNIEAVVKRLEAEASAERNGGHNSHAKNYLVGNAGSDGKSTHVAVVSKKGVIMTVKPNAKRYSKKAMAQQKAKAN